MILPCKMSGGDPLGTMNGNVSRQPQKCKPHDDTKGVVRRLENCNETSSGSKNVCLKFPGSAFIRFQFIPKW